MKLEKECNRMSGKIFLNEVWNSRTIGSMGNVRNLTSGNVKDVDRNDRGSIVGEDICKNTQGYTLE